MKDLDMDNQHIDEKGNVIDTDVQEVQEQQDIPTFLQPQDCVLEVGARYGTVSTQIQHILHNKKHHVAIEPDPLVLPALYRNRQRFRSKYHVFEGIISPSLEDQTDPWVVLQNGYGTRTVRQSTITITSVDKKIKVIPSLTYKQFLQQYPLPFNVLIVDCEGCMSSLLETIGDDISYFRLILLEKDMPQHTNYEHIESQLVKKGFIIERPGFHTVYQNIQPMSYPVGAKKNGQKTLAIFFFLGLIGWMVSLFVFQKGYTKFFDGMDSNIAPGVMTR